MINISEENKSFANCVNLFGHVFTPFFIDESNKLLIHLDGPVHKHYISSGVIIDAIFLMYKKFESQDVKADIEVKITLEDRKIKSVYYETHHMAAIEEDGNLVGVMPLGRIGDPNSTFKERKIFLAYISHCINELIRRSFDD